MSCPSCQSERAFTFHRLEGVPVNSMLELTTEQEAIGLASGTLELKACERCGFVFNAAFEPDLVEYSQRYDPTQAHSPTFSRWHRDLAERLVERFDLRRKRVVEIGCGHGEFLELLCEVGANEGIGFDPICRADARPAGAGHFELRPEVYTAAHSDVRADFVCCKMTLEHVHEVFSFVKMVRRALDAQPAALVFFQVPDAERILEEVAFWDAYYEHCSYFSAGVLGDVFERAGFEVLEIEREYEGQYLTIVARPTASESANVRSDPSHSCELAREFEARVAGELAKWRRVIENVRRRGGRTVVWGAGSKGVAFLTALQGTGIEVVVDINPNRQQHYLPVSAQRIVPPEFLVEYRPDTVIVMNPIYREEIQRTLGDLGVDARVLTT